MKYILKHIDKEEEFKNLKTRWNELLFKGKNIVPFLSFEWQYSWWKTMKNQRLDSLFVIIVIDSESCNIVGIAPLMITKSKYTRTIKFIGTGRSDYIGFITLEKEENIIMEIYNYILLHKDAWDVCFLSNILEYELIEKFRSILDARKFIYSDRIYEIAPYIKINSSFDIFLKQKNKHFKKNVLRQCYDTMKEKEDYLLEKIEINKMNVEYFVFMISEIEKHSWKYDNGTAHIESIIDKKFWIELLPCFSENNWLSAWILKYCSYPSAFIIGIIFDNIMYSHTSAYDKSVKGSGNIVRNNLIKTAFENKMKEFDFLCGDEAYKMNWTNDIRETYQFVIANKKIISQIYYYNYMIRWRLSKYDQLKNIRSGINRKKHWLQRTFKKIFCITGLNNMEFRGR